MWRDILRFLAPQPPRRRPRNISVEITLPDTGFESDDPDAVMDEVRRELTREALHGHRSEDTRAAVEDVAGRHGGTVDTFEER
ncbi:MAG TPA: hypothetical protein VMJ49_05665 [Gaiellaceae bacterium]|nr:hypothetical protein [Gaiellaceae bacterium]